MQRYVIIDTETTGLNPAEDRVFEIAAVEVIGGKITGKEYHSYINPEKRLSDESKAICKIDDDSFLLEHKKFADVIDDFLRFIADDAALVAHNVSFDINFINAELRRCGREEITGRHIVDTVRLAKYQDPKSSAKLDHVCNRVGVDISIRDREGHSAIIDCRLLSEVFCIVTANESDDYPLQFDKRKMDFQGFTKRHDVLEDRKIVSNSKEELELHNMMMKDILGD